MSTGLLDEAPLLIMPSLAVRIGLNESILLQQVHYWLQAAKKSGDKAKFQQDRWWTYSSYADWKKNNFPFWSVTTIKRTIVNLEKSGILIRRERADKASKGGSRTWYSIDYDQLDKAVSDQSGISNLDRVSIQVDQTFTETSTETPDQVPADAKAPRARSEGQRRQDTMVNALVAVLHLDPETIPDKRWSSLRGVAKQLLEVHAAPDDLTGLMAYAGRKRKGDINEYTLGFLYPDYQRDKRVTPDDTVPAVLSTSTAQTRALASMYRDGDA